MKRFYKITALALLALTIFVCFTIGTSAENAPSIERRAAKFDDGEIMLTFAVKSDSDALKLKVWGSYPLSDTPVLYETESFSELTVGADTYKVFSSQNILLQNLRKPYYAAIFALDSKGSEIARSEITKFSVFDYFLELLGTGTEDQIGLFTRLLNVGAAMQKQLLGTSLYTNSAFSEAGGYANEYYALKVNTYVDGELADSETSYFASPIDTRLIAPKTSDKASFVGFSDKDGTSLKEHGELTSSSWNELPFKAASVGITEVNFNYSAGGILPEDYKKVSSLTAHGIIKDTGTEFLNPTKISITTDKKGVESSTVISGSAYAEFASKQDNKFLAFYKIIKAASATTYKDENADRTGAYKEGDLVDAYTVKNCGIYLPTTSTPAEDANVHVFESDIYVYCTKNGTPTYVNLINEDGEAFWGFNIVTAGSGSTYSLTVKGGADSGTCFTEGITLNQRDWYNLRVEYGFAQDDTTNIKVYIDGLLTATYTTALAADKDATLSKVQLYHADGTNNATLKLDNTVITSVKAD